MPLLWGGGLEWREQVAAFKQTRASHKDVNREGVHSKSYAWDASLGEAREMKTKKTLSKVKKDLWTLFSIYVRMRDGLRTTGSTEWGLCVTCSKRYHFKMLQAGHFVAGRHSSNLFSERGVNAQCYNCNINLKGNTLEYRRKIIELYGEGADLELEAEARQIRKFVIPELEEMSVWYKERIEEMKQQNRIPLGGE